MSKPSARPGRPSPDLALFATQLDLPAEAAASPPDWIRIAPGGELRCRDGRVFTLDPKRLVERFKAEKVDIPIDLGHSTSRDHAAPALGWISELEARPDGLYGRVREWLDGGKAILKARTHRYVSPAFMHDASKAATWLHSVALVSAPALAQPALLAASRHDGEPPAEDVSDFAALLGLDASAGRMTCLAALAEMKAGLVPLAVHEHAMAQLAATSAELRAARAEHQAEKVEALIEDALKAKKIVPAERAEYAQMAAASDFGFRTVQRLFAMKTPIAALSASGLDRRKAETGAPVRSPALLAAKTDELLRERRAKGMPEIGYADAMSLVISATPEE